MAAGLVAVVVEWVAEGARLRARRPRPLRGERARRLGAAARHQLLPGRRRLQPAHGRALLRPRPARRAVVVARDHRAGRLLPLHAALDDRGAGRRVHRPRPVPLLLPVRDDARPHVLPDRAVGPRAARLRRHQVLPVHPDRRPAHAGLHPRPVRHPRPPDRRLHLRLPALARHAPLDGHGDLAHAGLLRRLRREAAGRAAAHLAARRPHPGADRRQPRARRPAHQDRRLRDDPLHGAAVPARRLPRGAGVHGARRARHPLRRRAGLRPDATSSASSPTPA